MDVITTHTEAEFDSFASMVAAKKLYPEARLVFPGSQEKSLRRYLRASPHGFGVQRMRSLDLSRVRRLILVDTRRADRIAGFSAIARRRNVEVHIYDHHPPSPHDLEGPVTVVGETGANISLMLPLLRKHRAAISPEEATLFALGLYEDTGSLTFASTTPRDLMAGAYLLERGANLNLVAEYLRQDLSPEQVVILHDLIRSLEEHTIHEVPVALATAATPHYVGGLSVITHKLRDMKSLGVLFVAVRMGDRIHLVARSRIEAVDVGEVAYHFGGGGHPTAASATVRSRRLADTKRRILRVLRSRVRPPRRVREMMTSPVVTVDAAVPLADARRTAMRAGLHTLPVVTGGRYAGLLSRSVAEKAIRHGFGEASAADYMTADAETVTPSAPFSRVEEIIVQAQQRFLPVVERGRLAGAVTRTDYLRALREEAARRPPFGYEKRRSRTARRGDISGLVAERLPARVQRLLRTAGEEGDRQGVKVYLVGGIVRDLLLNVQNLDLDIMVEGDGIAFARRLARLRRGRLNSYRRFETAVVVLPGGMKIDVATARMEFYESPGAVPTVEHGNIKMDLFRRDFTVNSLAIQLNPAGFGTLYDFFGGQKDLEDGALRVLHNLSFVEDPTRVFRAIRFEQRLHFRIGEVTHRLIKDAVAKGLVENIVGRRLGAELVLIFRETKPVRALRRMEELGLLPFIHPGVRVTRTVLRLFECLKEHLDRFGEPAGERWILYVAALSEGLTMRDRGEMLDRLAAAPRHRARILAAVRESRLILRRLRAAPRPGPGDTYLLLSTRPREVVLYTLARATGAAAVSLESYLSGPRQVKSLLNGTDLAALGLRPGPVFKEILAGLVRERVDGRLESREDEERWVRTHYPPGT